MSPPRKWMTPSRYAEVIAELGLSQVQAAHFLDVNPRTSRHWIKGTLSVPKPVAMLLELMVKKRVRPDAVEDMI
jgi:glyoxylate carboligase